MPATDPWLSRRLEETAQQVAFEDELRAAVLDAMRVFLEEARGAVLDGNITAAASMPPDFSLWPGVQRWLQLLRRVFFPRLSDLFGTKFRTAAKDAEISEEPYRELFLEEVESRLVSWPDTAFEEIRGELQTSLELEENLDQTRDRIGRVLDIDAKSRTVQAEIDSVDERLTNPDLGSVERDELTKRRARLYESRDTEDLLWHWQAERIARTETVAVFSAGTFEGAKAWSETSGEPLFKQWLASNDSRTRHAHRVADGQVQPLNAPFLVGGFGLMFPGDPTGSAGQVINCRCALLIVEAEDAEELSEAYATKISEETEQGALVADSMERDEYEWETDEFQSRLRGALRNYWVHGRGAARIRWGMPGDFNRCVRALRRHFPQNPQGLCANLHHEALGVWPGRENSAGFEASDLQERSEIDGETLMEPSPSEDMRGEQDSELPPRWRTIAIPMKTLSGDDRMFPLTETVDVRTLPIPYLWQPTVANGHDGAETAGRVERVWVEDGNVWAEGTYDLDSEAGREAARQASKKQARGTSVKTDNNVVETMLIGPDGEVVEPVVDEENELFTVPDGTREVQVFTKYRIMSITQLAEPAFAESIVEPVWGDERVTVTAAASGDTGLPLADRETPWDGPAAGRRVAEWADGDGDRLARAFFWKDPDGNPEAVSSYKLGFADIVDGRLTAIPRGVFAAAGAMQGSRGGVDIPDVDRAGVMRRIADYYDEMDLTPPWETDDEAALIAGAAPVAPPRAWFENPNLGQKTPMVISDDGRVYGHIAEWDRDHTAFGRRSVKPPKSMSYDFFHTGYVVTAEGDEVAVGRITYGGGHADINGNLQASLSHYDDVSTCVAIVRAYEDEFGIAVAGSLVPEATTEQVAGVRRHPPSGDWRDVGGKPHLILAHSVNAPGFPVVRASYGSDGRVLNMTAAGAVTRYKVVCDGDVCTRVAEEDTLDDGSIRHFASIIVEEMANVSNRRESVSAAAARINSHNKARIMEAATRIEGKGA